VLSRVSLDGHTHTQAHTRVLERAYSCGVPDGARVAFQREVQRCVCAYGCLDECVYNMREGGGCVLGCEYVFGLHPARQADAHTPCAYARVLHEGVQPRYMSTA
jgi:hypothetical protein